MHNNKIQSFPYDTWSTEFGIAESIGLTRIEWTLDYPIEYNPLLDPSQYSQIKSLCRKHNIRITGVTGDCFMQKPFWKSSGKLYEKLCDDFTKILCACSQLNIPYIVIPLVDNGAINNNIELDLLLSTFNRYEKFIDKSNVSILFESDFTPSKILNFIEKLPPKNYGINYDSGNSASLGYDPLEEINTYCHHIKNVHIKDRLLNGTTVELGSGNANLPLTLRELLKRGYSGSLIFQAARAANGKNDKEQLKHYIKYVLKYCN